MEWMVSCWQVAEDGVNGVLLTGCWRQRGGHWSVTCHPCQPGHSPAAPAAWDPLPLSGTIQHQTHWSSTRVAAEHQFWRVAGDSYTPWNNCVQVQHSHENNDRVWATTLREIASQDRSRMFFTIALLSSYLYRYSTTKLLSVCSFPSCFLFIVPQHSIFHPSPIH